MVPTPVDQVVAGLAAGLLGQASQASSLLLALRREATENAAA